MEKREKTRKNEENKEKNRSRILKCIHTLMYEARTNAHAAAWSVEQGGTHPHVNQFFKCKTKTSQKKTKQKTKKHVPTCARLAICCLLLLCLLLLPTADAEANRERSAD